MKPCRICAQCRPNVIIRIAIRMLHRYSFRGVSFKICSLNPLRIGHLLLVAYYLQLALLVQPPPRFVIKAPQPLIDAQIPIGGKIPERKLEGTPYVIMRKRVTQAEGHDICESRGPRSRLAVFPTIADAVEVSGLIKNISVPYTPEYDTKHRVYEWGPSRRYWIGLVDFLEEGYWVWLKSDGLELTYNFWTLQQPDHIPVEDYENGNNNKDGNGLPEHCVTLWNPVYYQNQSHTFNDETCTNKHYFICEDRVQTGKTVVFAGRWKVDDENLGNNESVTVLPFGITILDDDDQGGGHFGRMKTPQEDHSYDHDGDGNGSEVEGTWNHFSEEHGHDSDEDETTVPPNNVEHKKSSGSKQHGLENTTAEAVTNGLSYQDTQNKTNNNNMELKFLTNHTSHRNESDVISSEKQNSSMHNMYADSTQKLNSTSEN